MTKGSNLIDQFKRQEALEERTKQLQARIDTIKEDSLIMERIVRKLVGNYCDGMDAFSRNISQLMSDIKKGTVTSYSEMKLELKCIELANAMYEATEGLSILGSQSDAAKAAREEAFAKAYKQTQAGTIPDKKAEAAELIQEEALIEKIMERAYVTVSQKIKSANRVLEALKKVLTSRMIHKEVFRKEAPVYDDIDGMDLDDAGVEGGEDFDE